MAESYNSGYTQAQLAAMQRDAVRRVNEMQRIAREKLNNGVVQPQPSPPPVDNTAHHKNGTEAAYIPQPACETEIVSGGFKGILDRLNLDDEKILIMVLLLLLINEGSDVMLILALVYILL